MSPFRKGHISSTFVDNILYWSCELLVLSSPNLTSHLHLQNNASKQHRNTHLLGIRISPRKTLPTAFPDSRSENILYRGIWVWVHGIQYINVQDYESLKSASLGARPCTDLVRPGRFDLLAVLIPYHCDGRGAFNIDLDLCLLCLIDRLQRLIIYKHKHIFKHS